MQVLAKGSWVPPQTDVLAPKASPTKPHSTSSAEHKPPGDPSKAGLAQRPADLLTAEQEQVMIEHLPIIKFIARRIHERLPQHVPIEDLYSAGVLGLLDAFGRFDPSKQVKFRTYAQFRIRGAILELDGNMISPTVDAVSELVRRAPQVKIIAQFDERDESNTVELYRRGVRGIIPRSISPDLLVKCVRKIAAGEVWIDSQSVDWVIEASRSREAEPPRPRTQLRLSPKELAIITCITQGKRNKEIAHQLGTTEQVVKNYLRRVYDKLGVSDRLELAFYALHHQLNKKVSDSGVLRVPRFLCLTSRATLMAVSRVKRTIHGAL
jgi:RNA polymerase sigma factor (sigma-70 family)